MTASALLSESRWQEAAGLLRDLTAQFPTSADAHRLFGLALRERGDAASAENAFRQALALDARSGPTAVALSEQLLARGAFEEALTVVAELGSARRTPTSTFSLLRLLLSKRRCA